MIEFLTENWKIIAVLGSFLVELVLLLVFKKRPEIIDNSFLLRLCEWIDAAEKKYLIGQDKLNAVLEEAKKYLGDKYVEKDVKSMVEYVLSLPEKKNK